MDWNELKNFQVDFLKQIIWGNIINGKILYQGLFFSFFFPQKAMDELTP